MSFDTYSFEAKFNESRLYSPITLNREWSPLLRLIITGIVSSFGVTVNSFHVSSFLVEPYLRQIGNIFHFCLGFSDMMITGFVLPTVWAVILSVVWDVPFVCHILQTVVAASTYCYSIFFLLAAGETYFRICHLVQIRNCACHVILVTLTCIAVFTFCFALAIFGTYWKYDYDYCNRIHDGNWMFRLSTSILIHGTCSVFTIYFFVSALVEVNHHNMRPRRYRRAMLYHRDVSMIKLNMLLYVVYVMSWFPYLVLVNQYPATSDKSFYQSVIFGICRTIITNVLYGTLNATFGRAYSNLFYYCCCKISMQSYPNRHRNQNTFTTVGRPANTEIKTKTHILQQAVNQNNTQRAGTSTQETMEL